jgi:hypothetical protein
MVPAIVPPLVMVTILVVGLVVFYATVLGE